MQVILANLHKHTGLQATFACNMVALVDGTPQQLGLKDCLAHWLTFRWERLRTPMSHLT